MSKKQSIDISKMSKKELIAHIKSNTTKSQTSVTTEKPKKAVLGKFSADYNPVEDGKFQRSSCVAGKDSLGGCLLKLGQWKRIGEKSVYSSVIYRIDNVSDFSAWLNALEHDAYIPESKE